LLLCVAALGLRSRSEIANSGVVSWRLINMLSLNYLGLVERGGGKNAGALREMLNRASTNATENQAVRRASGPVSASTAAYPATRPTVAVRTTDTQVPPPGSSD